MSRTVNARLEYFGKLPSRGDFVRSTGNPQLLRTLDHWLSKAMELMADDPRWKLVYDGVEPMHFAFLGSRSAIAVAGHLAASADASSRRFPFIAATTLDVEEPLMFLARSPLALARLWSHAAAHVQPLLRADASAGLQALNESSLILDVSGQGSAHDGTFADFLHHQTLGGLEQLMQACGPQVAVRRIMLALGMLLAPLMRSAASRAEKGLSLPLPVDPFYRTLAAAFWMDLIAPFLSKADFETAIFLATIDGGARLVVGLDGGAAQTLRGMFDRQAYAEQFIVLDDPDWVDEQARGDARLTKLLSYLEQPSLSLRIAVDTFREAFIGN